MELDLGTVVIICRPHGANDGNVVDTTADIGEPVTDFYAALSVFFVADLEGIKFVSLLAIGIVHDENDAREVVQEAFLRVFKSLDRFQGTSAFFTWLYRIVKNLSIDHIRKPARREVALFDSHARAEKAESLPFVSRIDGADPIDAMRRKQLAANIQEALDALPAYHRTVIIMREVEGMSYQQMADAMEVSKGTIMSRLFHARQKLQRALSECYREHVGREPKTRGKKS